MGTEPGNVLTHTRKTDGWTDRQAAQTGRGIITGNCRPVLLPDPAQRQLPGSLEHLRTTFLRLVGEDSG